MLALSVVDSGQAKPKTITLACMLALSVVDRGQTKPKTITLACMLALSVVDRGQTKDYNISMHASLESSISWSSQAKDYIISMHASLECSRLWSNQAKDYNIGICCFSSKHAALRGKSKDWLVRNQDNVSLSGATCLSTDCCFSEVALLKSNSACRSSTKQTSVSNAIHLFV